MRGIILESGLSDLHFFYHQTCGTWWNKCNKWTDEDVCVNLQGKLAQYTGRLLIIHCKDDKIIKLEQVETNFNVL